MKVYPAFYTTKGKRLYIKQFSYRNKVDFQHKRVFHLEESMVMYGIYNSDSLETMIDTVLKLHNQTTWNVKLFTGKIDNWYSWYLSEKGVGYYAINSLLFLTMARETYVNMYERLIYQLKMYSKVIRTLLKVIYPFHTYCHQNWTQYCKR